MWTGEEVSESLTEIEKNGKTNEFRLGQLEVRIAEMDEAQRFRLDRIHEQLKAISTMANWCALAAGVYVVTQVIAIFR